jgi:hypothetical protein
MALWENKDGTPDWGYIVLMCCVLSCCLLGQCSDGGGGSNLPTESEWQRMSDEEKGKAIADEIIRNP